LHDPMAVHQETVLMLLFRILSETSDIVLELVLPDFSWFLLYFGVLVSVK